MDLLCTLVRGEVCIVKLIDRLVGWFKIISQYEQQIQLRNMEIREKDACSLNVQLVHCKQKQHGDENDRYSSFYYTDVIYMQNR